MDGQKQAILELFPRSILWEVQLVEAGKETEHANKKYIKNWSIYQSSRKEQKYLKEHLHSLTTRTMYEQLSVSQEPHMPCESETSGDQKYLAMP